MWHPKLLFFLAIHTFRRRKLSPSNLKLDSLRSESDRSELLLKITICCFFVRIWDTFRYSCEHDDMQARTMQAYVNNTLLLRNFLDLVMCFNAVGNVIRIQNVRSYVSHAFVL